MLNFSIVPMQHGCPSSGTLGDACLGAGNREEEAYCLAAERGHCVSLCLQEKCSTSNPVSATSIWYIKYVVPVRVCLGGGAEVCIWSFFNCSPP